MIDTVVVNDVSMDYCRFGQGDKVFVILPGLFIKPVTPSAESIAAAFGEFTKDYTVYLFDRRTNIPEGYSILDMAKDTVAVMKQLGIEKADIFGASQGGMIAQAIAIENPGFVEKMVLGSTVARNNEQLNSVVEKWVQLAKDGKGYELNEAISNDIYSLTTMNAYKEAILAPGNSISKEELERFVIMASSIKGFDVYDSLDKITAEVLVLGCYGDQVTTEAGAKEIADKLQCLYYAYEDQYGHAVFDEAADYRGRMLAFLTGK